MLPDILTPFKHYNEENISGVLDGIVTPEDEDSETCPSEDTMITTAPPLFRTAEGR